MIKQYIICTNTFLYYPNSMITMNTLKLFLCVCLMPGFSLYAQVRIHGKVTDLDNQPLAYSTVRLLKTDSAFISGTTTDTLGYYQFTNVQPDKYLLSIQYNRIQTANNTGKCFKPRYTTTCN